jgi:hypothetical protein
MSAPAYEQIAEQVGVSAEVLHAIDVLLEAGYGLTSAARLVLAADNAGHDPVPFVSRFLEVRDLLRDIPVGGC